MQNMLVTQDGKNPLAYELHDLQGQIRSLSREVERMAALIEARQSKGTVSAQ